MIAITFALPTESSGLRRQLRNVRRFGDMVAGKIGERAVTVSHTGVGAKNCNDRVETLLHKTRPRLLISSGFAGAVSEDLQVGDLILAENFSDRQLLSAAERILRDRDPRVAKLFTSTSIVDSVTERNEIARASGAVAVDMETDAIVGICNAHGVPLLSLRAISDTPKEPLPAPPNILFDIERQRTDPRKLFGHIIAGPSAIIRLLQFFRQIRETRTVLTDALVALVRQL
jgi:adenosylhomocysteine nucleosidase